jgi:lysyl-tRNA synthetase class 2
LNLADKKKVLELRSRMRTEIRAFFMEEGYLEVETPLRVTTPALEDHIDAEASGTQWLRTSPELHMKRMLCAGYERIYQMGPCFRQGERGDRHLPEYTMLEWYRTGVDSVYLMDETVRLIRRIAALPGVQSSEAFDPALSPLVMTVQDAFWLWAGWDPVAEFDEDRFDLDLTEKIEPMIAEQACMVILKDFPKQRAALARMRPENPQVAERWEMYIGGLELANAYTELTDAGEQRQRFEACAQGRKTRGQEVYPLDENFLQALEKGMPACAGIALGVDRLLMVLSGALSIQHVVAFDEE